MMTKAKMKKFSPPQPQPVGAKCTDKDAPCWHWRALATVSRVQVKVEEGGKVVKGDTFMHTLVFVRRHIGRGGLPYVFMSSGSAHIFKYSLPYRDKV